MFVILHLIFVQIYYLRPNSVHFNIFSPLALWP